MSLFGSYSKEQHTHYLEKEPDLYWKFNYPTSKDEAAMEHFMRRSPTTVEIFVMELALTFAETNIGEEDGEPFITAEMPLGVKQAHIEKIPYDLLCELAGALREFAPGWGMASKEDLEKQEDNDG